MQSAPEPARSARQKSWEKSLPRTALYLVCGLICVFLVGPILTIIPLSFNSSHYFTFPIERLTLHWYRSFIEDPQWRLALKNSVVIAFSTTLIATCLGTLAALGMSRMRQSWRTAILAVFLFPVVTPLVVTGVALFYFFASLRMIGNIWTIIIAHSVLAVPFVVVTVIAALTKFDRNLERAALSLGAGPLRTFFRVVLPAIAPGVASGAVFAFITSWDEVVTVIFLATPQQYTLPRQMWVGVRENVNPTLLAVAVVLTVVSVTLMTAVELARRHVRRRRTMQVET